MEIHGIYFMGIVDLSVMSSFPYLKTPRAPEYPQFGGFRLSVAIHRGQS